VTDRRRGRIDKTRTNDSRLRRPSSAVFHLYMTFSENAMLLSASKRAKGLGPFEKNKTFLAIVEPEDVVVAEITLPVRQGLQ
jgi:hypothetical protein